MNHRSVLAAAAGACLSASALAQIGPDVIVGDVPNVRNWGVVGDIRAYSIATTSCNVGTEDLLWIAANNQHPVIGQNMYRLLDGRFEHIGQSWLKHGFTAVNNGICGQCNGHLGSVLGVGCSDPYGADLNGEQTLLGPKSEVNAFTGYYPYPYILGWAQGGNTIYKRLQVNVADLNNPGALYFIEAQYVTADDAAAGNQMNNASHRRVTIAANGNVTVREQTRREMPAIFAWQLNGNGVGIPDNDVAIKTVNVPNDGRAFVAYKVTDNGDGTWNYEYAIENLNVHRGFGLVSVALGDNADISNQDFHGVAYHSGEPQSSNDWAMGVSAGEATWSTSFFGPSSNPLKWGTLYNYRFTANTPPTDGIMTLGLFAPGSPATVNVDVAVPSAGDIACPADCDGNGVVNATDVGCYLTIYFDDIANATTNADCDANGVTNAADVGCFLSLYFDNLGDCP